MKTRMFALLAVATIAIAALSVTGFAAAASHASAHTNNSDHTTGVAQCTFTHPASLPKQASANAVDALADRSAHCPPSTEQAATNAVSPAATHANHSDHTRGVAQCTFTHPASLPKQASANAVDALADRASHCPPTHPTA